MCFHLLFIIVKIVSLVFEKTTYINFLIYNNRTKINKKKDTNKDLYP